MASGVKLSALDGAVPLKKQTPHSNESPICIHNDLPLFDAAFVQHTLTNDAPTTGPIWLPPHLQQTVNDWIRLSDLLDLPEASQEELISKGLVDEAGNAIEIEPTEGEKWIEKDIDPASHQYLPRVVIPHQEEKESPKQVEPISEGDIEGVAVTPKPRWVSTRKLSYPFIRFWTEEQRKRAEIDKMLAESNLPTSHDKLVIEARRKGVPPPDPPTAEGPFRDELVVNAFNAIAQMAPLSERVFTSLGRSHSDTQNSQQALENPSAAPVGGSASVAGGSVTSVSSGMGSGAKIEGDNYPFLWDAIYPQDSTGRPCYNPKGVYVVRLWAAGAWRAVVINDLMPRNTKSREIWPMLLSKALYVALGYSSLGSRSGNTFSLCPREMMHPSTCSLACGGVFGFLIQALTGWQPDTPRTLNSLAVEPKGSETLPMGFTESDDGSAEGDEGDVSSAALALVRHLLADGVPCAPLEQFKFDDIYRAQVTAALGRDPFLVDSSKLRKWPRPPDKRKKGGKKKHGGGDLLATLRAAAITRERRVAELRTKIFDALERPRMYAICASSIPPEVLDEQEQKKQAAKESRRASRRESRRMTLEASAKNKGDSGLSSRQSTPGTPEFANLMNAGDQQQAGASLVKFSQGLNKEASIGEGLSINNSQTESEEFATSDMNSNVTTLEDEDDDDEEEEEEEEEEDEGISSNIPISSRLSGAINSVRPIARMKTMQTHGPPRYPINRMNCHVVLGIGLRASSMALPVVEATDLGKFGGDGSAVMGDRRLGWLRGDIKRDQDLLSSNMTVNSGNSVKLSDKLQNMDAMDAASPPEPKLLILWRDPKPYNESGGQHKQHQSPQHQQDESAGAVDQGGEAVESDLVDAGQAAAAMGQREQSMGIDDGDLPEFSPQHPAMAKGNLRWMTPSTFIKAMGGPQHVSLLQMSTRFHMAGQAAAPIVSPATAAAPPPQATGSKSKSSSSAAAAAAAAAASSAPPPLTNSLPKNKSEGSKVTTELAGSATLLTLRHHCDPDTRKPLKDRKPTILRIITPGSEETDDDMMTDNSIMHAPRMIRLLVSIEVDPISAVTPNTTMVPTLTADGAPAPVVTTPSTTLDISADVVAEESKDKSALSVFGGNRKTGQVEDEVDPPCSMGSFFLRPVSFIAGNPSNDDDDDDDDYGDDPSVKSVEQSEKPYSSVDLNSAAPSMIQNPDFTGENGSALFDGGSSSVQSGIHELSNADSESSPSQRKIVEDDDESILASVHAATLIAWVHDWKVAPIIPITDEGSDYGEKSSHGEHAHKGANDPYLNLPSGCYQHSVKGMPDGTMLLRLPQSRRKLSYGAAELGGSNLPFSTMTADLLLPRLPRQSRSNVDSRGTDTRSFSRDYFFEVVSKLPTGGSINFSCSEKMVLGTAQHVWGTALKNNYSLPGTSSTMSAGAIAKQEAAEKLALKEGWPHARHASGSYPTLPSTVPPCMQSARDRRGLGDYNENFENFAVLFRYRVKVLPPKHDGSSSTPSSSGGIGAGGLNGNDNSSLNDGSSVGGDGDQGGFASNTVLDDMIGPVTECGSRLKLYLSNPEARRYVRLVTVGVNASDATKVSMNFPLLETPPLRWRSDAKEGYVVMAILEKPPHVNLDPGSWSLVCLSDAPISKLVSLEKSEHDSESQLASASAEAAIATHQQLSSVLMGGETVENDTNSVVSDKTASSLKRQSSKSDPPAPATSKNSKRTSVAIGAPTTPAPDVSSPSTDASFPPLDQMVWKLPNGPMARAHRWSGVYQPNKELRLINDLISGGGSTELTLHVIAFPSTKSPISNFALRMRVFQKLKHPKHVNMDGIRPPFLNPRSNFELISDVRGMDHITLELVQVPTSGIIVELSLDERRMQVPSILRSTKSFSTIQLENSFSSDDVTWSSPKWRLMALPSNTVSLQLGPDPTISDWSNKLHSKWHELRLNGGGNVSDPMHEPFWLKGNDVEMEERKHQDAHIRKKYKTYLDRLKKGIKKSSFASSSNPSNSVANLGSMSGNSVNPQRGWFASSDVMPFPPIADRVKERKELLNMFHEDDRIKSNALMEAVKEGETMVEGQLFALNSMRSKTSDITSEWSEVRNAYRSTAAARKEAVAVLLKMGNVAKHLGEGEKGTCLEGHSKKDDKGKKGKKK